MKTHSDGGSRFFCQCVGRMLVHADNLGGMYNYKCGFRNLLIASEIIITAIVFTGFYLIFRSYKKKESEYLKNNKK